MSFFLSSQHEFHIFIWFESHEMLHYIAMWVWQAIQTLLILKRNYFRNVLH